MESTKQIMGKENRDRIKLTKHNVIYIHIYCIYYDIYNVYMCVCDPVPVNQITLCSLKFINKTFLERKFF